jgi:hypothetical protein
MGDGQRDGSIVVLMPDAEVQRGPQDADQGQQRNA